MDELMHDFGAMEGNPFLDAHFECHQHEDVDCEDASIADVINEMTGTQLTDENIVAEASHQTSSIPDPTTGAPRPMYDPANGGSHLQDAPALFAPHGVHAVYTDDQVAQQGGPASGMDALEHNLAAGDRELVGVDGEMLWDNAIGDAHTAADHHRADHVVTVTGIDTATGYAYLNDTGSHDQSTEMVPLDKFEDAWALSDHAMVSTDPTHAATNPAPLAVPGPIPPTPAADPFAPFDNHAPDLLDPTHHQIAIDRRLGNDLDTALLVAGVGAAGVAALSSRESRAAAVANTAALINRARAAAATGATTAAAQATAAVDRARTWIDQHKGNHTAEEPSAQPAGAHPQGAERGQAPGTDASSNLFP